MKSENVTAVKTIANNMVPAVEALSAGDITSGVTQLAKIQSAAEAMLTVTISSLHEEVSSDAVEVLRQKSNKDIQNFSLTQFWDQLSSR